MSLLAHVLLPRKNDGVGELFAHAQTVLCGIIDLLSNIRGGQSYLFSSLLQQSHAILGLEALPPHLAFPSYWNPTLADNDGSLPGPDDCMSLQRYKTFKDNCFDPKLST